MTVNLINVQGEVMKENNTYLAPSFTRDMLISITIGFGINKELSQNFIAHTTHFGANMVTTS